MNTLIDTPSNTLLGTRADDLAERVEAYDRTETVSFTEWMAEIFARRTER